MKKLGLKMENHQLPGFANHDSSISSEDLDSPKFDETQKISQTHQDEILDEDELSIGQKQTHQIQATRF